MKSAIEGKYPGAVINGNPEAPRQSSFEVTNAETGKVYWSKLEGFGFPKPEDLLAVLEAENYQP
eukprot:TRINITY_DN82119_c1_g1_i1.p1 TRINITY_DN82119_c1_g1~~TRINITY_DN82119_c1_g1_i1.p1  ORF type:complete len:64 (-),score=23.38 TRINITY_DN82119_c1_g1_i1:266-457(-)